MPVHPFLHLDQNPGTCLFPNAMWWVTLILLVLLWFQGWKQAGIVSELPLAFRRQNALTTTLLVF
jgi:hypothetical protein